MTRIKILMTALALPLILLSIACSTPTTPAGPQERQEVGAASSAPAAAGPVTAFADGDYEVGPGAGQVPPGKYKTTGAVSGPGCYWARLKGLSGELDDIKANGYVTAGAPGIMTVVAADKGVKVSGGCTWQRA